MGPQSIDLPNCEFLGKGSGGSVYKTSGLSSQPVALKIPHAELSHKVLLHKEVQFLSMFVHPNIVRVHGIGTCVDESLGMEGRDAVVDFMALDHIKGVALNYGRESYQIEPRIALSIVKQVASAVKEVHDAGYLHNDIKPSNIIYDPETKKAILIDFALPTKEKKSNNGMVYGTISYMSPEKLYPGKLYSGVVDKRADIYALGITLFEMLTGKKALYIDRSNLKADIEQYKKLKERIELENLPRILKDLLLSATNPNKEERFQNTQDLMDAIDRAIDKLEKEEAAVSTAAA